MGSAPARPGGLPLRVSGPTRLAGGPGSGHTEALVRIACDWLAGGGDPQRMMAVTRSHNGIRELRQRIEARLPDAHPSPLILTHELLARRVLAEAGGRAARQGGLDRVGEWLAMQAALEKCLARPSFQHLRPLARDSSCIEDSLEFVSAVKQSLVGPGLLAQRLPAEPGLLPELAMVAADYQETLRQMGVRDTRDLLADALEMLQDRPRLMAGWADLLLVDEAEDLTAAQWYLLRELILRLTPPRRALVAGDAALAAPGFRGPSSRYFEEVLPRELSPSEWSLGSRIAPWVERAAGLLGVSLGAEAGEPVGPDLGEPGPGSAEGRLWVAPDESEEAFAVASEIQRAVLAGEIGYQEVAVLVRNPANQVGPLLQALASFGVPFRVERSRWSGSLAVTVCGLWLRSLCEPQDEAGLLRLLVLGPRAVAAPEVTALRRRAARRREPLERALRRAGDGPQEGQDPLSSEQASPELVALASAWRDLGGGDPGLATRRIDWSQFQSLLGRVEIASGVAQLSLSDPDSAAALAQLNVAVRDAAAAKLLLGHPLLPLGEWLELVQLGLRRSGWDTERVPREDRPQVSVLTIQQAKGRHWRRVFLPGLVEGILPSRALGRGLLDQAETQRLLELVPELEEAFGGPGHHDQEERRALLLGITRGLEQVTCSWARRYGDRAAERSSLLAELVGAGLVELAAPRAQPVTRGDCLAGAAAELISRQGPLEAATHSSRLELGALGLARLLLPWDPVAGAAVELERPLPLSATAIDAWLACPRLFYYQRLRLGEPDSLPVALGMAAHRLLDLSQRRFGAGPASPDQFLAVAQGILAAEVMPEVRAQLLDPLGARYVELWLTGMVRRWAERVVAPGPDRVGSRLASEVGFELPRGTWTLKGRVDAFWRHPDGEIEVVDYKTSGSGPPSAESIRKQVLGSAEEAPSNWQLPIYLIAAQEGEFREWLGEETPSLARNWYPGAEPTARTTDPIPARGFGLAEESAAAGGSSSLSQADLDGLREELDRQARGALEGRFPALPRHSQGTCRSFQGCPLGECCDGEGTVGAGTPGRGEG